MQKQFLNYEMQKGSRRARSCTEPQVLEEMTSSPEVRPGLSALLEIGLTVLCS
jgi:hypothetical protein